MIEMFQSKEVKMKKGLLRRLITGVCVATMMLGLIGCGSSSEKNDASAVPGTINIGVFDMGTLYLMQTFDDMEYFKNNGANLEFTYFPVYSDAITAFNTGNVDMICYAIAEGVAPVVNGVDCKVIGVFDTSNGLDGIAGVEGIESMEDFKGKTIATEIGSVDHMLLQQALIKNGMSEDDVNVINMSAGDAVAAMASGTIQGVSSWEPQLSMAAEYGSIVYSTKDDPDLIADVFLIHSEVLDAQYDNAKAFVKTWFECAEEYQSNPKKFSEKAAEYGNISEEEFNDMMAVTRLLSLEDNEAAFTVGEGDNKYLNVLLRTVGDFLYEGELITANITDEQITDMLDGRIITELLGK